jgi:hypothetical protein
LAGQVSGRAVDNSGAIIRVPATPIWGHSLLKYLWTAKRIESALFDIISLDQQCIAARIKDMSGIQHSMLFQLSDILHMLQFTLLKNNANWLVKLWTVYRIAHPLLSLLGWAGQKPMRGKRRHINIFLKRGLGRLQYNEYKEQEG